MKQIERHGTGLHGWLRVWSNYEGIEDGREGPRKRRFKGDKDLERKGACSARKWRYTAK